jgi:hypothetical protein
MAAPRESHASDDQTSDQHAAAENERALGRGARDHRPGDRVTGQGSSERSPSLLSLSCRSMSSSPYR